MTPAGRLSRVGKGETGLLIAKVSERFKFEGYTDPAATEKKLFRDVFEDGDVWVNSGDLMRNIGFGHLQFIDRVGDTFRWKSENVSTGEVETVINGLDSVAESTVYGVQLPGAVGRAGMVAITPTPGAELDLDELLRHMKAELPAYAIPLFIRITETLDVTGTFKHRKVELRGQEFDPSASDDPLYVLLAARRGIRDIDPGAVCEGSKPASTSSEAPCFVFRLVHWYEKSMSPGSEKSHRRAVPPVLPPGMGIGNGRRDQHPRWRAGLYRAERSAKRTAVTGRSVRSRYERPSHRGSRRSGVESQCVCTAFSSTRSICEALAPFCTATASMPYWPP